MEVEMSDRQPDWEFPAVGHRDESVLQAMHASQAPEQVEDKDKDKDKREAEVQQEEQKQ